MASTLGELYTVVYVNNAIHELKWSSRELGLVNIASIYMLWTFEYSYLTLYAMSYFWSLESWPFWTCKNPNYNANYSGSDVVCIVLLLSYWPLCRGRHSRNFQSTLPKLSPSSTTPPPPPALVRILVYELYDSQGQSILFYITHIYHYVCDLINFPIYFPFMSQKALNQVHS